MRAGGQRLTGLARQMSEKPVTRGQVQQVEPRPAPDVQRRLGIFERITIHLDSRPEVDVRLGLSQAYVALLAFQLKRDRAARDRFLAQARWLAERVREGANARDLPRDREIESGLRRGLRQFKVALVYAERLVEPRFAEALLARVDEAARNLAAARTSRRAEDAAAVRPSDQRRRLPSRRCHWVTSRSRSSVRGSGSPSSTWRRAASPRTPWSCSSIEIGRSRRSPRQSAGDGCSAGRS